MITITFSHIYKKMPFVTGYSLEGMDLFFEAQEKLSKLKTQLLEVLTADRDELSSDFIQYDTEYITIDREFQLDLSGTPIPSAKIKNYPLPKGRVLILLLVTWNITEAGGFNPMIWTTIRRHTPEKAKYYQAARGQDVNIILKV